MRKALAAAIAAVFISLPAMAAEQYFSALEELPLMPGMHEVEGMTVFFDSPHGRIVNAAATTMQAPAAVRGFYSSTLPALGWRPEGDTWRRTGETLSIAYEQKDKGVTLVRVSLTPHQD